MLAGAALGGRADRGGVVIAAALPAPKPDRTGTRSCSGSIRLRMVCQRPERVLVAIVAVLDGW